MIMLDSFTPKTIARLLFYPAAIALLITLLSAIGAIGHGIFSLVQDASFAVFLGGILSWYATVAAAIGFYVWCVRRFRPYCASQALIYKAIGLIEHHQLGTPERDKAVELLAQSNRAKWSMLGGMASLFLVASSLLPAHAHAHSLDSVAPLLLAASDPELGAPKPVLGPTSSQLELARKLQNELHLNEHGVIRTLRYLGQGYSEAEVRNLFAPVVRK